MGLSIQALIRGSALRQLPRVIVLGWSLALLARVMFRGGSLRPLVTYFVSSLLIGILFWPEAVIFGRRTAFVTDATRVTSYVASQDPGAEVVTAADTQQVPPFLQPPSLIAPGFGILLRAWTNFSLAIARAINSETHQPFHSLLPMQWLLGVSLTTDITNGIADWVHNCYLPVQTMTLEAQQGRTVDDLLPWGDTPLRQGLATRSVIPGAQTGITFMQSTAASREVACDVYLDALESDTQAWLFQLRTPRNTPLLQVFQEDLGMEPQTQARFILYREMLRASQGGGVPAPSLTGTYAALRGLAVGGQAVSGAATGWLSGIGALIGTATGTVRGLGTEFQAVMSGLSWLIRAAILLVWFAPYVVGIVTMVHIALFPIVLLWVFLSPGSQLVILAQYFVALLFTSSIPLWWALVDQVTKLAASAVPSAGSGYDAAILGFLTSGLWVATLTAVGILLIPVITWSIYFKTFRYINGLARVGA